MTATSAIEGSGAETDTYVLDGNAIAGVLEELFDTEMTTARRVCQSCGRRNAIGAHRAHFGAGIVLRCPHCRDVAMVIAPLARRTRVRLAGEWTFEAPVR
ncbi:MAG TPA: DUF6510 family protein [Solirubrobacteraceae bacterium]|jgi:predicted RNA-binding Zn-ribbon protein involved in translation (DUF1610 family)